MAPNSSYAKNDPRALMARAIMRPLIENSIARKWIDGSRMDVFAGTFIKPSEKMTSLERLEVYNQQYWYRLLDSMRDDFPGLLSVLGDERFTELSIAYLTKYPSQSFTLRNLGQRLEKFVREDNERFKKRDKKLILDVVSFEWSEIQAFDAEMRPAIDFGRYSNLAGTDPKLDLQPYVFILSLDYAVDEFLLKRKKFAAGRTVVTARTAGHQSKDAHMSKPKKQKTHVVIHRQDNIVFYKRINGVEYKVLAAIKAGASLTEACAAIGVKELELAYGSRAGLRSLGESFHDWTRLGWFCDIKV